MLTIPMFFLPFLATLGAVAQIGTIAARTDAATGVCAVNLETGKRIEYRANERFPMGSVFKLPLGIYVIHEIERGRLTGGTVTLSPEQFSPGYSRCAIARKARRSPLHF